MGKMACTPLFSVLWWRVIYPLIFLSTTLNTHYIEVCLDESQMIDKGTSMISTLCKKLEARARWSITGTPISASIRGSLFTSFFLYELGLLIPSPVKRSNEIISEYY